MGFEESNNSGLEEVLDQLGIAVPLESEEDSEFLPLASSRARQASRDVESLTPSAVDRGSEFGSNFEATSSVAIPLYLQLSISEGDWEVMKRIADTLDGFDCVPQYFEREDIDIVAGILGIPDEERDLSLWWLIFSFIGALVLNRKDPEWRVCLNKAQAWYNKFEPMHKNRQNSEYLLERFLGLKRRRILMKTLNMWYKRIVDLDIAWHDLRIQNTQMRVIRLWLKRAKRNELFLEPKCAAFKESVRRRDLRPVLDMWLEEARQATILNLQFEQFRINKVLELFRKKLKVASERDAVAVSHFNQKLLGSIKESTASADSMRQTKMLTLQTWSYALKRSREFGDSIDKNRKNYGSSDQVSGIEVRAIELYCTKVMMRCLAHWRKGAIIGRNSRELENRRLSDLLHRWSLAAKLQEHSKNRKRELIQSWKAAAVDEHTYGKELEERGASIHGQVIGMISLDIWRSQLESIMDKQIELNQLLVENQWLKIRKVLNNWAIVARMIEAKSNAAEVFRQRRLLYWSTSPLSARAGEVANQEKDADEFYRKMLKRNAWNQMIDTLKRCITLNSLGAQLYHERIGRPLLKKRLNRWQRSYRRAINAQSEANMFKRQCDFRRLESILMEWRIRSHRPSFPESDRIPPLSSHKIPTLSLSENFQKLTPNTRVLSPLALSPLSFSWISSVRFPSSSTSSDISRGKSRRDPEGTPTRIRRLPNA